METSSKKMLVLKSNTHGGWGVPKGSCVEFLSFTSAGCLEPGEKLLEAAYRELQEETGFTPDMIHTDGRFVLCEKYQAWGKSKSTHYAIGWLEKPLNPKISEEHLMFRWVGVEEANGLDSHLTKISKVAKEALGESKI